MRLDEVATNKGTYAGVKFSDDTSKLIKQYLDDNKIPNAISPNKLHTTLLYSRKHLPDYKAIGTYPKPLIGTPGNFDVWKSNNEDGSSTNCLVVEFDCPELSKRHDELMDEHKATYDFPDYKTHITLSYDIGDMDIKDLPSFIDTVPTIKICKEYQEQLDLDWAKNKGTSK